MTGCPVLIPMTNMSYQTILIDTDTPEMGIGLITLNRPDKRNAISVTMGISGDAYKAIVDETQSFITKLANIVKNDNLDPERVYQYELLLFPLSHNIRKKKQP